MLPQREDMYRSTWYHKIPSRMHAIEALAAQIKPSQTASRSVRQPIHPS